MDFAFTPEQYAIRDAVAAVCADFDLDYWLKRDREGGFPLDFHAALARAGWLGIAGVIGAITWAVKGSLLARSVFLAMAGTVAVALALLLNRLLPRAET